MVKCHCPTIRDGFRRATNQRTATLLIVPPSATPSAECANSELIGPITLGPTGNGWNARNCGVQSTNWEARSSYLSWRVARVREIGWLGVHRGTPSFTKWR